MTFKIGQEVVCIDNSDAADLLTKGHIYTVASFGPPPRHSRNQTERVKLVETGKYQDWWQSRFRPVVKTNISIFTEILERESIPSTEKEKV